MTRRLTGCLTASSPPGPGTRPSAPAPPPRSSPGLFYAAVPQGHGEVQGEAVALGDPLLGVDAQVGQHVRFEEGKGIPQSEGPTGARPPPGAALPAPPPGGRPRARKRKATSRTAAWVDLCVHGVVKAGGHVGRRVPPGHRRRGRGCARGSAARSGSPVRRRRTGPPPGGCRPRLFRPSTRRHTMNSRQYQIRFISHLPGVQVVGTHRCR